MTPAQSAPSTNVPGRDVGRDQEFIFGDKEFDAIAEIVRQHSGIILGRHKKTMAYSRLVRRLRTLGLSSFKDYCGLLRSDAGAAELPALINAITTNLTKFFRESHHFDHLKDVALPQAFRAEGSSLKLRIWSAGCSTGEEPYSIAMTLAGGTRGRSTHDIRILATDLDTGVLATASRGIYSSDALEVVPAAMRNQHMRELQDDRGFQVDQQLRNLITFNQLNLLGDWPFKGGFDAIFCRNVMIYFDGPTKKILVERLASKLKLGGWLYIGHSETLLDHHPNLRLAGRTIYQKIPDA